MNGRSPAIAVIGASAAPAKLCRLAYQVGRQVAARGAILICGGRSGVMKAAAQGAQESGGHTIGIIPGYGRRSANRYIEFVIATGMGEARNAIVVGSSEAVIALDGEAGTLSEIALALKLGRPVVALKSWNHIEGLHRADEPAEAVACALRLARPGKGGGPEASAAGGPHPWRNRSGSGQHRPA